MTPAEKRGRNILVMAMLLLGGSILWSFFRSDLSTPSAWLSEIFGYGVLLLLLYFAFRGGGFSLGAIRFALLFFGSVLLLATITVLLASRAGRTETSFGRMYSLRAFPMLLSYGFLVWTFFVSPSVRAFIAHQRSLALRRLVQRYTQT
jgi:hypothetical protein